MASSAVDDEIRDEGSEAPGEQASAGNWLGRSVLIIAIVAFLIVYVAQLSRGSGLMYAVLFSAAAMGVVGIGGIVVRQILLRTASNDRAARILDQMHEITAAQSRQADTDANE